MCRDNTQTYFHLSFAFKKSSGVFPTFPEFSTLCPFLDVPCQSLVQTTITVHRWEKSDPKEIDKQILCLFSFRWDDAIISIKIISEMMAVVIMFRRFVLCAEHVRKQINHFYLVAHGAICNAIQNCWVKLNKWVSRVNYLIIITKKLIGIIGRFPPNVFLWLVFLLFFFFVFFLYSTWMPLLSQFPEQLPSD